MLFSNNILKMCQLISHHIPSTNCQFGVLSKRMVAIVPHAQTAQCFSTWDLGASRPLLRDDHLAIIDRLGFITINHY